MTQKINDEQGLIVRRLSPAIEDIVRKINEDLLTDVEINELCLRINDEFNINGLLSNWEPNDYGIELEKTLDIVNHPRIS